MAGKFCDGTPTNVPYLRDTKAYCEGRNHAANGGLVGDNPHYPGSEANIGWAKGFNSWTEDPNSPNAPPGGTGKDCCADGFGGGFVVAMNQDDEPCEPCPPCPPCN